MNHDRKQERDNEGENSKELHAHIFSGCADIWVLLAGVASDYDKDPTGSKPRNRYPWS